MPPEAQSYHFGAVHEMSEKVTIPRLNRDLLPVAPHEDPAAEIAGDAITRMSSSFFATTSALRPLGSTKSRRFSLTG